jgi:hypothetical protein
MRATGQPAPPDVVGYPLDEAKAALAEAGWSEVEISETRPPRRALTGPLRVLRQRVSGHRIALVVSGERPAAPADGAPSAGAGGGGAGPSGAPV